MQDEHVWGLKQGSAWDVGSKLSLGLQVEMLKRPPSVAGEWICIWGYLQGSDVECGVWPG